MTAQQVVAALRVKYPAPGFAAFEEVGNSTGASTHRHADLIVASLYPSAGLWVSGFEVKVSRGDWLRELKHPEKAEAIARHCNYWWVVAPDSKVVLADEAPPNWGVMTIAGESLRVQRAPKFQDRGDAIPREFAVSLFRAAEKYAASPRRIAKAINDARTAGRADGDYRREALERELNALLDRVSAFERASGLDLNRSFESMPKIGGVVRRLLQTDKPYRHESLHGMLNSLRAALRELEGAALALDEAEALVAVEAGLAPVADTLAKGPG